MARMTDQSLVNRVIRQSQIDNTECKMRGELHKYMLMVELVRRGIHRLEGVGDIVPQLESLVRKLQIYSTTGVFRDRRCTSKIATS